MLRRSLILILAFGLLPAVTHLGADTIELKSGERIEGTFKQATSGIWCRAALLLQEAKQIGGIACLI